MSPFGTLFVLLGETAGCMGFRGNPVQSCLRRNAFQKRTHPWIARKDSQRSGSLPPKV